METTVKKVIQRRESGNVRIMQPDPRKLLATYHRLKLALKNAATYVINMGGGGSAKSYSSAQFFVERLLKQKHKLLVVRKTGETLTDSVVAEFIENALPFWGLSEGLDYTYNKTNRVIKFTISKSVIIFKGLDNPEKLKSIPGVTLVWFEEASELTEKEFDIVNDRIRGNPEIHLTFNPISEQHWIKPKFIDRYGFNNEMDMSGKSVGCFRLKNTEIGVIAVLFSTFFENPYIGPKYIASMRGYKKFNPDHFRVYGLGLWGIIRSERPFFSAWKSSNHKFAVQHVKTIHTVYLSWDFNIKNTVLISQRDPGKWINYLELWNGTADLMGMCNQVVNKYGRHTYYYFTGDASGNNGSALTESNQSAWELIYAYFLAAGVPDQFIDFSAIPRSNGGTEDSRTTANMVISYYGSNLRVNYDNCKLLYDDCDRMESLPNGKLDKAKCNKFDYGHAGDTFRYDLKNFEGEFVLQRFMEQEEKFVNSSNISHTQLQDPENY